MTKGVIRQQAPNATILARRAGFETISGVGLPLGNLTSQLLVNIYMNEFDRFIKHRLKACYYLRYADDFVVLSRDRNWLVWLLSQAENFLWNRLWLLLHPQKMRLLTLISGVDFLGWVHFPDHRVLRTTTRRRIMRRVREHPVPETLHSYLGLLSHGSAFKLKQEVLQKAWLDRKF